MYFYNVNVFIASVQNHRGLLTSDESWHCAKVLRKKNGDPVRLIDGEGNFYDGVLELVSEKQCTVKITNGPVAQPARHYRMHLAIAPTKQIDRVEWMLEKAVEIGIDEISFISCKNSERTVLKTDRMKKIVESAVKQSLQALLPKVNDMAAFGAFIRTVPPGYNYIAHCFETDKTPVTGLRFRNQAACVLIGPEGDFTREEVSAATDAGFKPLDLGANRLRSETAGLYVCQAASLLSQL